MSNLSVFAKKSGKWPYVNAMKASLPSPDKEGYVLADFAKYIENSISLGL